MSYVVLARKWRPQSFADLVGQEHVSRTLQNAIETNRVAHAFLFTGVRGVGKTTSARILAKALNCLQSRNAATAEPCLKCAACQEITLGVDLDVQEVDGASYTGVDDIRRLQSSLQHRPARDRYKVFIVDEVHMLSSSAWNAFLKTLEEPPPHVKFILATTEVHKVPITILSRVQRFDFRMITLSAIVGRLRFVLEQEKIEAEDAALGILAREAAGSMRDAMSLLDQVLAYDAKMLRADAVSKVLGVASHQVLYSIAQDLLAGNAEGCVRKVGEVADQGFNISTVARDLLALLRNLVVCKVCTKPDDLIDLPDPERRDVERVSQGASADDLIRLHQGFSRNFDEVVRSGQPRAALEMLLIRLAQRPPLIPIEDWVSRLTSLEQRLTKGGPNPGTPPGNGTAPGSGGRDRGEEPRGPRPSAPVARSSSATSSTVEAAAPPAAPPTPPITKAQPAAANGTTDSQAKSNIQLWGELLDKLKGDRPELASMLQHVLPISVTSEQLVLNIEKGSVFETTLGSTEAKRWLERGAAAHLGGTPKVTFRPVESLAGVQTLATLAADAKSVRKQAATERAKQHPKVLEAMEILGGRIKEVRAGED